jgi:hypothetical protein
MMIDWKTPHAFRPDEMGYTRWALVVDDDDFDFEGNEKPHRVVNGMKVYKPKPFPEGFKPDELNDEDLFRFQMSTRRWREPVLTTSGEAVDQLLKVNDDFGQGLQMIYVRNLLESVPLTKEEKFNALVGDEVTKPFQPPTAPGEERRAPTLEEQKRLDYARFKASLEMASEYGESEYE